MLIKLLHGYRNCQASDLRDKVFALIEITD